MRKLEIRVLSLTGVLASALLSTACFTPADFGAGVAAEEHGEAEHGDAHEPESPDVAAVAEQLDEGLGEGIVEGIQPGTAAHKLEIKRAEIPYEAPFDGKPLSSKTLASGVVIEDFVLGEGNPVADNTVIEFLFKGYASSSGGQVMGSRAGPAKLVINQSTRDQDPIAKAMAEGLAGMKPGGKRRIKVPSEVVEVGAPPGRPSVGDLLMTVELIGVEEAINLHPAADFEGEGIATTKRPDGLTITDYAAGEGRESKPGDQVVTHYIGALTDGTVFDSSHSRTEGMPVVVGSGGVIKGFDEALVGVRPGMLRKVSVPPELGYGDVDKGKIPPNSTLVFMLQIMDVKDGPINGQAPIDIPIPKRGGDKPEGDKPAKPAKPPKPPKPADAPADGE